MAEITLNELNQIELFEDCTKRDLRAIAELFERETYPAGKHAFRQGQRGQKAYYVQSGKVIGRHVNPQGITEEVVQFGPGDFFGETSLLLGEPHDVTAEVVEDAVLLSLQRDAFREYLRTHSSARKALNVREDIARKMRAPRFKWLDPDEIVIVSLHKHNILLSGQLALPFLGFTFGLLCMIYGITLIIGSETTTGLLGFLLLIFGIPITLGMLGFGWYLIVDHLNDDYVLTNKRVADEERRPFGRETRAEAPLHAIQDIQQIKSGLLARVYDFGDLIIETAGERGHVMFRQIPHPEQVQDTILTQIQRAQAWAKAEEHAAIRDAMREHFDLPPLMEEELSESESASSTGKRRRMQISPPSWVQSITNFLRYFLPPMRHEEGNTITWRKHWVALIGPIWLPSAIIAALTLAAALLLSFGLVPFLPALLVYGILLIFLFPWWLWRFDDWQNDIYQVTKARIIDVERKPFYLREERREASLGVIQNITLDVPDFLARILNYGSVTIETAGSGAFTFDHVKNPQQVQSEIFRRVEEFRSRERKAETVQRRTELLDWFSVYDQVRGTPAAPQPPSTPKSQSQQQEP